VCAEFVQQVPQTNHMHTHARAHARMRARHWPLATAVAPPPASELRSTRRPRSQMERFKQSVLTTLTRTVDVSGRPLVGGGAGSAAAGRSAAAPFAYGRTRPRGRA
jgi:hypothetical protein